MITSTANAQVKELIRLMKKSRARDEAGVFLVEGPRMVGELLEENCFLIENIDATIIAQAPKMRPHIDRMRQNMADALEIDISQINVKATTEEGLGFTGTGEGISSQAICLLNSPMGLYDQNVSGTSCEGCQGCSKA